MKSETLIPAPVADADLEAMNVAVELQKADSHGEWLRYIADRFTAVRASAHTEGRAEGVAAAARVADDFAASVKAAPARGEYASGLFHAAESIAAAIRSGSAS